MRLRTDLVLLERNFSGSTCRAPATMSGLAVEEQGPVVQDAVSVQPLGRAGNLASLHQNIVAAGGLRLQPQALQRLYHRGS